jgi:hypothetical protein
MKDGSALSRRNLLRDGIQLALVLSAPTIVTGCSKEKLQCTDTSGLNTAALQLRNSLEYQDISPHGETKRCSNCQFFRPPSHEDQCGSCTLVQGPINPEGYCNSWAPKEG